MGTRCNVIIKFGDTKIILYRHYDGYLEVTGESVLNKLRLAELRHTETGIINVAKLVQLFLVQDNDYRLETDCACDGEFVYEINLKSEYQHGAHYNFSSLVSLTVYQRDNWEEDNYLKWSSAKYDSVDYDCDFEKLINKLQNRRVA